MDGRRMVEKQYGYLSLNEARERLNALEPEQVAQIKQLSRVFTYGTDLNEDDLLVEAITRILEPRENQDEGRRRWPVDVDVVPFLHGIIRSISSHRRDEIDSSPEIYETDLQYISENSDESCGIKKHEPIDLDEPHHFLSSEQFIGELQRKHVDDAAVLCVLATSIEGLSRDEGCKRTGLSKSEYEAALRRLRRGIDPHYGKRAK
jgi:hypothetical protein